jgi:hypothetical protein
LKSTAAPVERSEDRLTHLDLAKSRVQGSIVDERPWRTLLHLPAVDPELLFDRALMLLLATLCDVSITDLPSFSRSA